ncbi:MAG: PKD domain-containing protein [Verrucomicrobia bacterium]|nr:PKD domain-containing protein [Verrucomicrobiota bacterium]
MGPVDNKSRRWNSWDQLCNRTKTFVADGKSSITWFTLGFDPGSRRPATDCGVTIKAFPDPSAFTITPVPAVAKPVAAFEADPLVVKPGQSVNFKLLVVAGINSGQWNFGDGAFGNGTQVTHAYSQIGTFSPTVEVVGPGGTDRLERLHYIQVVPMRTLKATFAANPKSAKVGEEILFSLESSAGIRTIRRNFGDGQIADVRASDSLNVRHVYSAPGKYTVLAEVEGPDGRDSSGMPDLVDIKAERPVSAAFLASPRKVKVGEEILYTLKDASGVSKASWSFGDGTTSSNILANHAYQQVGDYDVAISVEGPGGKDSQVQPKCVSVRAEVPMEADFTWSPERAVAGETVRFIDLSSGTMLLIGIGPCLAK